MKPVGAWVATSAPFADAGAAPNATPVSRATSRYSEPFLDVPAGLLPMRRNAAGSAASGEGSRVSSGSVRRPQLLGYTMPGNSTRAASVMTASEPGELRRAVRDDPNAPGYPGSDGTVADRRAEDQLLNELQEQYLSETKYRPIDASTRTKVVDMTATELQKEAPANRGYWMIDPAMKAYERLTGHSRPEPRDMGPIADLYVESNHYNPADYWASFKPAARFLSLSAVVPDLVNSLFLTLGPVVGSSKTGSVGLVATQFLVNVGLQIPMGYLASYGQFTSELLREFGSVNRSRRIKDNPQLGQARSTMRARLEKAKAVGDLSKAPTEEELAIFEKLLGRLSNSIVDRQVVTGDNNTYYAGKERASIVAALRQCALFISSTGLRLGFPEHCHLGWQSTGMSLGIVWLARAMQIAYSAPNDDVAKQQAALIGNLQHADLSNDKVYRDFLRSKAATRMDHAEQDIAGRIATEMKSIASLLCLSSLDVGAFEQAGGFGLQELTGELEVDESAELARFREADVRSVADFPRERMLRYNDLERRSGQRLAEADLATIKRLGDRFDTSSMSAYSWEQLDRSDAPRTPPGSANLPIGTPSLSSEAVTEALTVDESAAQRALRLRESLRPERAAESLTPREHAKFQALKSRARYVPPDVDSDDFAGAARTYRAIKDLLDAKDGPALATLRGHIDSLIGHRIDESVIRWDWTKLSHPAQQRMHDLFVGGKSIYKVGLTSTAHRVFRPEFIVPTWVSRLGGQLHGVVFGPVGPFIVGGVLRSLAAYHPSLTQCREGRGPDVSAEIFSKQRAMAQGALLIVSIVAAMAGVQSVYNSVVRRSFNQKDNPGKVIPGAGKIFVTTFPRAMFTVQLTQIWERLIAGPLDSSKAVHRAQDMQAQLNRMKVDAKAGSPRVSGSGAADARWSRSRERDETLMSGALQPPVASDAETGLAFTSARQPMQTLLSRIRCAEPPSGLPQAPLGSIYELDELQPFDNFRVDAAKALSIDVSRPTTPAPVFMPGLPTLDDLEEAMQKAFDGIGTFGDSR